MKFLKIRHYLILALGAFLSISLLIFFFGGLRAKALDNGNEEFDLTGYINYSVYNDKGNYTVSYTSEAELNEAIKNVDPTRYTKTIDASKNQYTVTFKLSKSLIVAQNSKYTMFLNEDTTIVTVALNSECTPTSQRTEAGFINYSQASCKTVYSTAIENDISREKRSNLLLYYVGSNSKVGPTPFNTYTNSVLYHDLLADTKVRHYQIKFNGDGIEILYEIGDFTVINSFFPRDFKRTDMEEYFRGNLLFLISTTEGSTNDRFVYSNQAWTWSKECAAYLEEKELATVKEVFGTTPFIDDNGQPIPSRYDLTIVMDEDEEGRPLNRPKAQLGIDYNASNFSEEGASPCTSNPFFNSVMINNMFTSYYSLQSSNGDEKNEIKYNVDYRLDVQDSSPTFNLKVESSTIPLQNLFNYMYNPYISESGERNYFYMKDTRINADNLYKYPGYEIGDRIPVLYDENPYDDIPAVEVPMGGFHARDEDGNYLYDEEGKPIQDIFKKVYADYQNENYKNEVESFSPVFQVAMRFTLTDKGLETLILNDSLKEGKGSSYRGEDGKSTLYSHNCLLGSIDVLPAFTINKSDTSYGQIILPDGSGAVINFNSPKDKLNYTAYAKSIYGNDMAFPYRVTEATINNEKLMFPMYGFLDATNKKGVLAIVERGANQTSIYANFKRSAVESTANVAYFQTRFRESETVYAGTANTPFLKWSKEHINNDLKFVYHFLMENEFVDNEKKIQYVTLAKMYRDYLIDRYEIVPKDYSDNVVLNLNFLGAFEKRELVLGFVRNVDYSLTTFEQAREIIQELMNEGITDYSVAYTSWTSDGMDPKASRHISVARVLGGQRNFKSFNQFLQDNEIKFYPEVRIASAKDYDYSFGNLKYTAKSIGSSYARQFSNVIIGMVTFTRPDILVSPKYYNSLATNLYKSYNRFGVEGSYIRDVGNFRLADYARKGTIFAENGMDYQVDVLEKLYDDDHYMMLSAPFDYALKYADFAVDIPMQSSLLGYYDHSIPFYQLVVSGLFDYTGPAINFDGQNSINWYLLKSLETGSNLNFLLSYEDTKILLDTDYTMYFNAYYKNWKNNILYLNKMINDAKIHHGVLTNHKILQDNVFRVEYSNGTVIVINYNNTIYFDSKTGLSVRPNWYTIVQEGS